MGIGSRRKKIYDKKGLKIKQKISESENLFCNERKYKLK
jgi:hypothetical protein